MWRFFVGGPEAVDGLFWWETCDERCGCLVAKLVGARIPDSTYRAADPEVSQWVDTLLGRGSNSTAILPLEGD